MSEFLLVLGLAALPASGNLLGGLLARNGRCPRAHLSLALHLAAGIVLGVLMHEASAGTPAWVPLLAFVAGGAIFIGLDRAIGYVQGRLGGGEKQAGALAIFSVTHPRSSPSRCSP